MARDPLVVLSCSFTAMGGVAVSIAFHHRSVKVSLLETKRMNSPLLSFAHNRDSVPATDLEAQLLSKLQQAIPFRGGFSNKHTPL